LRQLDALCGQHDCRSSRLFWFTDLEAAKATARREHKPILSLHLFGELTDPLSCANSRFFRSVLYPDPAIGGLLRDRFVLHWKSVRRVPKVTIDFGDGRKLVRTLTGNSVHHVLDPDGRPLDALPGLLSPHAFRGALEQDLALAEQLATAGDQREAVLAAWHRRKLEPLVAHWAQRLAKQGAVVPAKLASDPETALVALDAATRVRGYAQLATPVSLAPEVEKAIAARFPDAWRANERAPTKAILESPVLAGLREIEWTFGRDSIENELWHHGRIHAWFVRRAPEAGELVALNRKVYGELFQSPLDDPWYGLMPSEAMRAFDACAVTH
jgi:hypothetical protein